MKHLSSRTRGLVLSSCLVLLGATSVAHADITPGLDFTGGFTFTSDDFPSASATIGWTFTVTSPITITSLGVWDEGADGLSSPKQVGLWNNANQSALLAQTTVTNAALPAASTSTDGRWLFQPLEAPQTLTPGTYTVGVLLLEGDTDPYRLNTNAPVMTPGTAFVTGRYPTGAASTTLKFPAGPSSTNAYFGANFGLGAPAAATPEPGSVALLTGMMAAGVGVLRRRCRGGLSTGLVTGQRTPASNNPFR